MCKIISIAALVAMASLPVLAQADETRCRSANDVSQASAWGQGTATGFPSDTIIIRNCYFQIVDCRSVWNWAISGSPAVNQVVNHSGGQCSIRFNYYVITAAVPLVQGGTVEVVRNGAVIDRDRLY